MLYYFKFYNGPLHGSLSFISGCTHYNIYWCKYFALQVTEKHKTDFDQLKKSLSELKSQLGNVEKILNAYGWYCA
jgi:hypothetical protein